MLTLFAGRLVQLQGLDSASYKTLANLEKHVTRPRCSGAARGTVYSSNHQVLAMTTETYTITADPPLMKAAELPTVAQELSGPLDLPAAKILSLLQHPTSTDYVQLAVGVSVANDQKIEALSAYHAGIYDEAPATPWRTPNGRGDRQRGRVRQRQPAATGVIARPGGGRGGVQQAC